MNPGVELRHAIVRHEARIAMFRAHDTGRPLESVIDIYAAGMESIIPQSVTRWAERNKQNPDAVAHATLVTIFERDQRIAERFKNNGRLPELIKLEEAAVARLQSHVNTHIEEAA